MFRKFGLPIIAALGALFGIVMLFVSNKEPPKRAIEFPPPTSPYTHFIAGTGIIESNSENILIGSPFDEIVEDIFVTPGQNVAEGEPLFSLDSSALRAALAQAEAQKNIATMRYTKLVRQPRKEEVPPAVFRMEAAKVEYENEQQQYDIILRIADQRAISHNERNIRKSALDAAEARYKEAKSNLELLTSGAWLRDIEVSKAEIVETQRAIDRITTDLNRSVVRAPSQGQVLQVNIRKGEKSSDSARDKALMVFGSIDPLYMRIEIDQDEAWRFIPGAPATAFLRGNSDISFPLEFVRIEPYIVPKQALTGDGFERVDTRVLHAVYAFPKRALPVYVGLITDIYIQAKP